MSKGERFVHLPTLPVAYESIDSEQLNEDMIEQILKERKFPNEEKMKNQRR